MGMKCKVDEQNKNTIYTATDCVKSIDLIKAKFQANI